MVSQDKSGPRRGRIVITSALFWIAGLTFVQSGEYTAATVTLVEQLGSSRFVDREAASAAILSRGRDAIAALKTARLDADPEIRLRAETLIERIERQQMRRTTNVTLEAQGEVTLGLLRRDLERQTGFRLEFDPDEPLNLPSNRIEFERDETMSLWDALARLNIDGYWRIDTDARPFRQAAEPVFLLRRRSKLPPSANHGPFRLVCRDVELGPTGQSPGSKRGPKEAAPAVSRAELRFELMAEPRLELRALAPPRIVEARDEHERSLLPAGELGFLDFPWPDVSDSLDPSISLAGFLAIPDPPPQRIAQLKCEIDVEIEARRVEPTTYPLVDRGEFSELNETIWCGDVLLCSARVSTSVPGRLQILELVLQPDGWTDMMIFRRRGRQRFETLNRQIENLLTHIELVDTEGRPLRHGSSRNPSFRPGGVRVESVVTIPNGHGSAASLHYYGLIRDVVTLEFTLRDVPLEWKR